MFLSLPKKGAFILLLLFFKTFSLLAQVGVCAPGWNNGGCENSTCGCQRDIDVTTSLIGVDFLNLNIPDYQLPSPVLFLPPKIDLKHKVKKAVVRIQLDMGPVYQFGDPSPNPDFQFVTTFFVKGVNGGGLFDIGPGAIQTITITEGQPRAILEVDITKDIDKFTSFGVTDLIVNRSNALNPNSPLVPVADQLFNALRLQVSYEYEYEIDVRDRDALATKLTPPFVIQHAVPSNRNVTNRNVTFAWDNQGWEFPNYEFQLVKLGNILPEQLAQGPLGFESVVDWSQALTIETKSSDTLLTLPLAEGSGYYAWRVRPVGTYYPGGYANSANWGLYPMTEGDVGMAGTNFNSVWAPLQGLPLLNPLPLDPSVSLESNLLLDASNSAFLYFDDPDAGTNYQVSRTYGGGTQMSEEVDYYSDVQQLRQEQYYQSSDDQTLIKQTVPDYSGREAMKSLPVPVNGRIQGYQQDFMKADDNAVFHSQHFDADTTYQSPFKVLDINPEAYSYYSNNNPDQTIPNAKGHPYGRGLWVADGTNRFNELALPGEAHTMGNGHTTRRYYGTPTTDELVRVFGDETPFAERTFKEVELDENSTATVTYYDNAGNIIAKALALSDDTALVDLDGPIASQLVTDEVTTSVLRGDEFISSKRIPLTQPSPLMVDYQLSCAGDDGQNAGCGGVSCKYKVKFLVFHLETGQVVESDTMELSACDGSYMRLQEAWDPFAGANVGPGTFIVEKHLFVNDPTVEVNENLSANIDEKITPFTTFIQMIFAGVEDDEDMEEAYNTFEDVQNWLKNGEYEMIRQEAAKFKPDFDLDDFDFDAVADDLDLNLTYSEEEPDKPVALSISTSCCGSIDVGIGVDNGAYECPEDLSAYDGLIRPASDFESGGVMDWIAFNKQFYPGNFAIKEWDVEQYLINSIASTDGNNPIDWETVVANEDYHLFDGVYDLAFKETGFRQGDMNRLVYHMLTDQDLCEPYKCEDVWKCFINQANAVSIIVKQYNENANQGGYAGTGSGQGSDFGDHFLDNYNPKILKIFLGLMGLDEKMEKESSSTPGYQDDLAIQFIDCIGYQHVAIVLEHYVGPSGIIGKSVLWNVPHYWETEELSTVNANYEKDEIEFNQVGKGRFMFSYKYYIYRRYSSIPCEQMLCFDPSMYDNIIQTAIQENPGTPLCYEQPCEDEEGFRTWTCDQIAEFKGCADNYVHADPEESDDEEFCPSEQELKNERDRLISTCETGCDERRGEVRARVREAFLSRCYTFDGCYDGTNPAVVSEADVEAIVDEVVENICKAQCQLGDEPDYPVCEIKEQCLLIKPNITGFDPNNPLTTALEITVEDNLSETYFGTACQQLLWDQAMWWDMEFDLPSMCEGEEGQTTFGGSCNNDIDKDGCEGKLVDPDPNNDLDEKASVPIKIEVKKD